MLKRYGEAFVRRRYGRRHGHGFEFGLAWPPDVTLLAARGNQGMNEAVPAGSSWRCCHGREQHQAKSHWL